MSSSRPSVVNSPSERSTPRSKRRQPQQRLQRAGRRRLDQVADGRERIEQEVRIDLGAQRAQLCFGGELADFLLADFAMVPLARDPDRVDATRDTTAIASSVATIVGQERRPPLNCADGERETRRIGRRHGDTRDRRPGSGSPSRASRNDVGTPPITTAPRPAPEAMTSTPARSRRRVQRGPSRSQTWSAGLGHRHAF